jgi:hypothetical protein
MAAEPLARLDTLHGPLFIFDVQAVQALLSSLPCLSALAPLQESPGFFEGYTAEQWCSFAKKKTKIASTTCRELGRMKARSVLATPEKAEPMQSDKDPVFEQDPWSSREITASKVSAPCPSGFGSGVHLAASQSMQASASALDDASHAAATTPCARKPMVTVLRVEWSGDTDEDLPMDDICDYFESFGQVVRSDMPGCPNGRNLVELDLVRDPSGKTLQLGKHIVTRSDDGKKVAVRVAAKLDKTMKIERQ